MKVAVAGASGFVGRALIEELQKNHQVVALSRASYLSSTDKVEWKTCDLFSLLDAERALQGADVAIYLVHSQRPSAHLVQGTSDDFNLIVADNFVRAAEKCAIKQIIYLGGMHPDTTEETELSQQLRSRSEVEEVFRKSAVPSTILRASMIIGCEGSSFQIMNRLIDHANVLACPSWMRTISQPISLGDIVLSINHCVANSEFFNQVYDIGGPQKVDFQEILQMVAQKKGRRRQFLKIPMELPRLSGLWIRLITQAPKDIVKPLIESLKVPSIVASEKEFQIPGYHFMDVSKILDASLSHYEEKEEPVAFQKSPAGKHVVRSVQRLPLPEGKNAEYVAHAYQEFLPKMQAGFMKVEVQGRWIYFRLPIVHTKMLILEYSPERSWSHRQLFYVRGGLLARKTVRGRLEFREILGGTAAIAAIHDFQPRMPWFLYRWTQALFHLWVMNQFGHYLNKIKKSGYTQSKEAL